MNKQVPAKKEESLMNKWKEQMELIRKKTGIHGGYVILFLIISIVLVYFNIFETLITNLVGTLYPMFWTIKSIETNSNDLKQWLTYWVVFGAFMIADMFSVIIMKFIPFYFVIKIVFLIWCFMPNSGGTFIVYNFLVLKLFRSIETNIDNAADKVKHITNDLVSGLDLKQIMKSTDIKFGDALKKYNQSNKRYETYENSAEDKSQSRLGNSIKLDEDDNKNEGNDIKKSKTIVGDLNKKEGNNSSAKKKNVDSAEKTVADSGETSYLKTEGDISKQNFLSKHLKNKKDAKKQNNKLNKTFDS
jgi:receptor expression-enhancing protein 5/6